MVEQRETILIVDDTVENIDLLHGLLTPTYLTKVATNGESALKIAASEPAPDLILLDIMMPGMDGYALCRQLKKQPATASIPIIFVTAMGEEDDERMGLELGAVDYITKPISPAIVQARVKTHLALYNQNRILEERVRQRTLEVYNTQQKLFDCLGKAAEYRDTETGAHVIRVGKSAQLLAQSIDCDSTFSNMILHAAPLHDIGKIGIEDHILLKPGRLTVDEFTIMKTHASIGAEIIGKDASGVMKMARGIALGHHEKWDGSGYPSMLQGENIPIESRIVAIVDVFDALTSTRPYKSPWPLEKVLDLYREQMGKHFDPTLCETFLAIIPQVVVLRQEFPDTA